MAKLISSLKDRKTIRDMKEEGFSYKEISNSMKYTIEEVSYTLKRAAAYKEKKRIKKEGEESQLAKIATRCNSCGHMVYKPCIKCGTDNHIKLVQMIRKVLCH